METKHSFQRKNVSNEGNKVACDTRLHCDETSPEKDDSTEKTCMRTINGARIVHEL